MLSEFKTHINTTFPFLRENSLLLACSGGVDSTVLAHLCKLTGLNFTLAHCNFNLRGAESNADEAFVRDLAKNLGVEINIASFDVSDYIEKNGGSVQMAARTLRYQWFNELLDTGGHKYVLTAHHADDSLETFLINLSRGTGLHGLTGIPAQNGKVVRPLLRFSRKEIMGFAQTQNMEWREDSSNQETKYLRNKVRKELVPKLEALHPTFLANFKNTQGLLNSTQAIVDNHISQLSSTLFRKQGETYSVGVDQLLQLQPLESYLYELFSAFGFTSGSAIKELLTSMSGKELRSQTHRLLKDRSELILTPKQEIATQSFAIGDHQHTVEIPIPLKFEPATTLQNLSSNTIFVDKEKLNYPLLLRKWEKGDYFYPFGMQGKKKVSKFFKDEKVDVLSKEKQWLLCSGKDIVWIVGRRLDDRFKVDGETAQILKITWLV